MRRETINPPIIIAIFLLALPGLQAQENDPWDLELGGYVKYLQTAVLLKDIDNIQVDNLIHHRLEATLQYERQWEVHTALRTRFFYGDLVRNQPNYADNIRNASDDFFDWSAVLLERNAAVLHTTIDRAYLRYNASQWEITLGRQRINWGISTLWNPNDLFNAYSFTDFDYEERPGSDALRVRRYIGFASGIELAIKAFETWDDAVSAAKYDGHTGSYDYQILTGYYRGDLPFGVGWAGNVGQASWKGETTAFFPTEDSRDFTLAATTAVDYTFTSGLYILGGLLYNHSGHTDTPVFQLLDFDLSARSLYPYKFSIAFQTSYPISPLWNASLLAVYSPIEVHPLFLSPGITYSIAQNWDLDFIGQIVFNDRQGFESPLQLLFWRVKYSF